MVSVETEMFVRAAHGAPPSAMGFAEPDWQGDRDYRSALAECDLDDLIAVVEITIEIGRNGGGLDAYYARRAAFDLQSIRVQIARERRSGAGAIAPDCLAAILSRVDRLSACLRQASTAVV